MSPFHPVAPPPFQLVAARKSQDNLTIVQSSELSYYPITETDIQVIIVLWVLFLVTSVFVGLRLYSRVKILQFYAIEDYLYNVAFVSSNQLPYTCLVDIASFRPFLPLPGFHFHFHRPNFSALKLQCANPWLRSVPRNVKIRVQVPPLFGCPFKHRQCSTRMPRLTHTTLAPH